MKENKTMKENVEKRKLSGRMKRERKEAI